MEKTIYIPGDLVMTNGIPIGTKKGIVYQVTESNADKYAKVKDGNAFTELKGSVTLSNLKGKTIKDDGFLFCDSDAWVKDYCSYSYYSRDSREEWVGTNKRKSLA